MRKKTRYLEGLALAASVIAIAGCAPAVKPPIFHPIEKAPLAGLPTGQSGWPSPDWWLGFHDPQLNELISEAMESAPSVEEAEARYRNALAQVNVEKAQLNPKVTGYGSANVGHNHINIDQDSLDQSSHSSAGSLSAGALATWDLDLWGKQRAQVASRIGQARAAEAEHAAAANSLQNNLVNTYYQWQTLQARIALAEQIEHYTARLNTLISARVSHGLDDPQTLDSSHRELAAARLNLATLRGDAALNLAQLAAIIGVSPKDVSTLNPRPLPHINPQLPPDASLNLIGRRPDIIARRWQIESALQDINAARAAYYPDVSLTGLGGFLRLYPDLGSSGHGSSLIGNIGPSISLPFFSGGRLKAQDRSAQAELDANVASYNQTVVNAAQDISRQVLTLQQLAQEKQQQQQEYAAVHQQTQRIAHQRRQGVIDDRDYYRGLIQLVQQQDALTQLSGTELSSHIALIHALGGGYQNNTQTPSLPTDDKSMH